MLKQGYFDGNKPLTFTNLDHLQQQAKEMEKEQIEDAYWEGGIDVPNNGKQCQQYYNETYGGNK
jgi:hypothetical protein